MVQLNDHFQEFISDPTRRRIYEREALAMEASELVSRLMEEQGVNRAELAERVGTSRSHITQLLSGSRNLTVHTLADLAFALGHKVEIASSPLSAVTWVEEFTDDYTEAHSGEWLGHFEAYRPCKSMGREKAPLNGGLDGNITMAA